ncbi:MAG: hypothetical protein ABJC26_04890 [Gemmatimonadaceae bacterium]
MSFTLYYTAPTTPDVVLKAILHDAAHWQESFTPAELRKKGVLSVEARTSASRFRLFYLVRGRGYGNKIAMTGRAKQMPNGQSLISARVGLNGQYFVTPALFAVLALTNFWIDIGNTAFLVIAAALSAAIAFRMDSSIAPTSDMRVTHLVDRFQLAMTVAKGEQQNGPPDAT